MEKVIIIDHIKDLPKEIIKNTDYVFTIYNSMYDVVEEANFEENTKIIKMSELEEKIIGELNDSEANFRIMLDTIEILLDNNVEINKRVMKSIESFLTSVKTYTELRIPREISVSGDNTIDECILEQIREDIAVTDNYFNYEVKYNKYKKDKNYFLEEIKLAFKSILNSNEEFNISGSSIVVWGAHIITPPQTLLLHYLDKLGCNITYILNGEVLSNGEKSIINEIIEYTYEGIESEYHGKSEKNTHAYILGRILEGKNFKIIDLESRIKLQESIEFVTSMWEYKHYEELVKCLDAESIVFAAKYKENSLKSRMVKCDKNTFSLLNNPIGNFLMAIYKMYDSRNNVLILNDKIISECLLSGFLINDASENGKEYIGVYENTKSYFDVVGCNTSESYINTCNHLIKNIINNDLGKIEYIPFNQSKENIEKLKGFFCIIKEISERLFGSIDSKKNILKYFESLKVMIEEKEQIIQDNENEINFIRSLLTQINKSIKSISNSTELKSAKISCNSVSYVIENYLNVFNNIENEKSEKLFNEVSSLKKIDDSEHLLYKPEDVYIFDYNRMSSTGGKGKYTRPIRFEKIKKYLSAIENKTNMELEVKILKASINILEHQSEAANYLLYRILKNPKKKTFIRLNNDKGDNEHFFETRMKEILRIDTIQNLGIDKISGKKPVEIYEITSDDFDENKNLKINFYDDYSKDIFDYCPLRWLYYCFDLDKIKDKYLFNKVVNILIYSREKNLSRDQIEEKLKRIFIEYPQSYITEQVNYYFGKLNKKRKHIENLKSSNNLNNNEEVLVKLEGVLPYGINIRENCIYCPHNEDCPKRVYE